MYVHTFFVVLLLISQSNMQSLSFAIVLLSALNSAFVRSRSRSISLSLFSIHSGLSPFCIEYGVRSSRAHDECSTVLLAHDLWREHESKSSRHRWKRHEHLDFGSLASGKFIGKSGESLQYIVRRRNTFALPVCTHCVRYIVAPASTPIAMCLDQNVIVLSWCDL